MNYTEVLKSIGWPTKVLILDFETFFNQHYSLNKMSTINYIKHRMFRLTGLGYQFLEDEQIHFLSPDLIDNFLKTIWDKKNNIVLVAKNCKFDMTILAVKFGMIFPWIIDIDDLLRNYDARMSHKMKDVAPMFGLQSKGDTQKFKGLHYEEMDAETKKALDDYCKGDIKIESELFKILLPKISNPIMEIPLARHTLDLYLFPKIRFDFSKAIELKKQMQEKLTSQIENTGLTKKELGSRIFFPKHLQSLLPKGEMVPMKNGKKELIPALSKTDEAMQALCSHPDERVRTLCQARLALKSWAGHIKRIDNMMNQALAEGGKLRVPLNYYGAHCVPKETEILTESGWQNIENWNGEEKIAQWDKCGDVIFDYATPYKTHLSENICVLNNNTIKAKFTRGHKIPYFTKSGNFKIAKAGDMQHCSVIPLTGKLRRKRIFEREFKTRLLVAIQADGHWQLNTRHGRLLRFGFRKQRKIVRLKWILDNLKLSYKQYKEKSGTTRIEIKWRDKPDWLRPEYKFFDKWLFAHDPGIIFDELVYWDGWKPKNSNGYYYYTSDKINADWIQIIGTLSNKKVSIILKNRNETNWSPAYKVFISSKEITSSIRKKHWSIEEYEGNVFCPLTKTGFWIARYENKVFITGNTGRWSGGEKINLQNLGGRGRAGAGTDPLISAMRGLLCAPDGATFLIVDSAQIEARILSWIAGQQDLIDGFARGEDIYSVFATQLFGCEVRKPIKTDSDSDRKILKIKRGFGKDAILGNGYGLGANTSFQRCRENNDLRPMFDSGEYDWDFIDKLIKTYRRTYAEIPKFWGTVEKAFKWVTKYPHEVISYMSDYKLHKGESEATAHSLLTFWNQNGTVHLQLPSGRILMYRHCTVKSQGGYSKIKWHWGTLWGGAITENIVQSIARDALGVWILKFEENNLPVVLTSHDEIVSLVPKTGAEEKLQLAINIMSSELDWAKGLPLDAEGELSSAYEK